ncbi:MAG: guanylate kinase [Magnetococcales bacterium]|nr:guanylate kinase [Magnetococcales bacterium]
MTEPGDRGFILILSAPSGAGKTTLARVLGQRVEGLITSVSTTTRQPRGGEVEGEAYFFVRDEVFRERVAAGEFLEWAEVFGNCYGTSRVFVEEALAQGKVVLLDIDWQGARQVRGNMPEGDVVGVAVLPPSQEMLLTRLRMRGQDAPEVIARRMAQAGAEVSHWREYDYIVVNDDLERAGAELVAIVTAERLRRARAKRRIEQILATFGFCI